jgi:acyl carrier protein
LVPINAGAEFPRELHLSINRPLFDDSAFSIFFVAQLNAIAPLYGERSRDFCMIEAGLMAQLLEMEAPACGVGLCQVGVVESDALWELFDLDDGHLLVHGLVGGGTTARPVAGTASSAPAHEELFAELRASLAKRLPPYMVPGQFVALGELPLTPTGKVDRKSLPTVASPQVSTAVPLAPRDGLERTTLEVFQRVLGVTVGAADNIFDLGADSLTVTRIHVALEQALGVEFELADLFEHHSVDRLVTRLTTALDLSRRGDAAESVVRPAAGGTRIAVGGYQLELAELEAALNTHPEVRAAAVVERGAGSSHSLIVHIVLRDTTADPYQKEAVANELRSSLETMLPSYITPPPFVIREALPLTGDGCIDRAQLTQVGGVTPRA